MALAGIEIGGTKLQLGVGDGRTPELKRSVRRSVRIERGAAGILRQIEEAWRELEPGEPVSLIGIGFGGPVDADRGRTRLSHQVAGWEDFALADWCREKLGVPAVLANDCDAAALAESRWGAGRDARSMFYVTVGTGIGGGHVVEGRLQGRGRPSIAEIGHLRLRSDATAEETVESLASGSGIARQMRRKLAAIDSPDFPISWREFRDRPERITAVDVAEAARGGDSMAADVLRQATETLGWAIGQVVTLLAPETVVVGGGVPQMPAELFWEPLTAAARRMAFPSLADAFAIKLAELQDAVVVHGALAVARQHEDASPPRPENHESESASRSIRSRTSGSG